MIRNVCIHVSNEQPLLADLYDLPSASDAGLVCTNVRSMDGKRPVFIDSSAATFFFPYHVVRFLEIPEGAVAQARAGAAPVPPARAADPAGAVDPEPDRRLAVAVAAPSGGAPAGDDEGDLEIDEEFLQRIRDI